jgi:uncharacterized protein (TIGR04255 family)
MAKLRDFQVRQRCIYGRNPLAEVIAAIKFPPQLAIEEQLPIEFQGRIKQDYPLLELKNIVPMVYMANSGEPARSLGFSKAFDFISEDKTQRLSLSTDNFALTTTSYKRWEHFKPRYVAAVSALMDVYKPPLVSRLGLRYKDIIDRAEIGLPDTPWDHLISAELLQPFTFFAAQVDDTSRYIASMGFDLDGAKLNINFGFVQAQDTVAFLIDTDCYVDPATYRTSAQVEGAIEELHRYSSLAFSRSITDELHAALQPQPA